MNNLTIEERRERIAAIDEQLFFCYMKDHLTHEDDAEIRKLRIERQDLCDKVCVWIAKFDVMHAVKPICPKGFCFKVDNVWYDCYQTEDPLEIERLRKDPNAIEMGGYWGTTYREP